MSDLLRITNPNASKKAAIEAAKARAVKNESALMVYKKPELSAERMRVVFDDSGSMSHQIKNAKDGVTEYFRNCIPNTCACSVHFLCTRTDEAATLSVLDTDLPQMAKRLDDIHLNLGGTPLFSTMHAVVQMDLTTRIIAFTDGSPTDSVLQQQNYSLSTIERYKANADVIIAIAKERHIAIDTVYFGGDGAENEIALLRYFSENTGGIFLHFDPAKVNFSKAFKYLAPVHRKQLMSPTFRADLEAGKVS